MKMTPSSARPRSTSSASIRCDGASGEDAASGASWCMRVAICTASARRTTLTPICPPTALRPRSLWLFFCGGYSRLLADIGTASLFLSILLTAGCWRVLHAGNSPAQPTVLFLGSRFHEDGSFANEEVSTGCHCAGLARDGHACGRGRSCRTALHQGPPADGRDL